MSKLSVNVKSMSSLEIAELTGKRHDNVMNDIRKMLEDLDILTPEFSAVRSSLPHRQLRKSLPSPL